MSKLLSLAQYIMGISESSIITIIVASAGEMSEEIEAVYRAELDRRHRNELLVLTEPSDHKHLAWISSERHPFNIDGVHTVIDDGVEIRQHFIN